MKSVSRRGHNAVQWDSRSHSNGLSSATLIGLSQGATYRMRLSLWDVELGVAVASSDCVTARTMAPVLVRRRAVLSLSKAR